MTAHRPLRLKTRAPLVAVVAALLLGGVAAAKPRETNWQLIATQRDHERLKNWRKTWVEALAQARAAGFGAAIDAEGAALLPDAAIDRPDLPDGSYRCETIKLGHPDAAPGMPAGNAFARLPAGQCRVAGGVLQRMDGVQRQGGRLYRYDGARLVFLGAMAVGDEDDAVDYPRDTQRALAGFIERIGPDRWRLVLPRPAWQSRLDVVLLDRTAASQPLVKQ